MAFLVLTGQFVWLETALRVQPTNHEVIREAHGARGGSEPGGHGDGLDWTSRDSSSPGRFSVPCARAGFSRLSHLGELALPDRVQPLRTFCSALLASLAGKSGRA